MGMFDFVKNVGKKLGFGDDEAPKPEELKKDLDSY
ncbi:peptidoglycan-binding protein LysM, partial [Rhizobiaceae sp. 2RAB30]